MRILLGLILTCLAAPLAVAHPHVFIDTGFELVTDDAGRLTHVRVRWEYDDFYSLLMTEDLGLDPDGDGALTDAETKTLTGFDMNWVEGFNGDLVAMADGTALALSGPKEVTATLSEGRIVTTHLRAVAAPPAPDTALVLKPFDPTYYTAYEISRPITVSGGGACTFHRARPDLSAELQRLQDELATLDAATDPADAGLPDIGGALSERLEVRCAAS